MADGQTQSIDLEPANVSQQSGGHRLCGQDWSEPLAYEDENYVLALAMRVENAALRKKAASLEEQLATRDEMIRNLLTMFSDEGRVRPLEDPKAQS